MTGRRRCGRPRSWTTTTASSQAFDDPDPRVRLEAIRSFAKMKADVPGAAKGLVACLRDPDVEVRREALQAGRPLGAAARAGAGIRGRAGRRPGQRRQDVRELAAEAMAAQSPEALLQALPLLQARGDAAPATVEALIRSGRPEHVRACAGAPREAARGWVAPGPGPDSHRREPQHLERDGGQRVSAIALDDYIQFVVASRARGDACPARQAGLRARSSGACVSSDPLSRAEGLETLLNFGPSWLAAPLARLLDRDSFETGGRHGPVARPSSRRSRITSDRWVQEAAARGFCRTRSNT